MEENPYKTPESNLETHHGSSSNEFYVVSLKKFTTLFFITVGIYQIYWFYRNWAQHKAIKGSSIWPVPRSIFSIFFTHKLFTKVQNTLTSKSKTFSWNPNGLASWFVFFSIVSQILDRMADKEFGSPYTDLIAIVILGLVYWPLAKAQRAINYSQDDPEGESNKNFTAANYIWIFIGTLFWLLIFAGFLLMFGVIAE